MGAPGCGERGPAATLAQTADRSEDLAKFGMGDRLEIANAQQHQILGLLQGFTVGGAEPGKARMRNIESVRGIAREMHSPYREFNRRDATRCGQ